MYVFLFLFIVLYIIYYKSTIDLVYQTIFTLAIGYQFMFSNFRKHQEHFTTICYNPGHMLFRRKKRKKFAGRSIFNTKISNNKKVMDGCFLKPKDYQSFLKKQQEQQNAEEKIQRVMFDNMKAFQKNKKKNSAQKDKIEIIDKF